MIMDSWNENLLTATKDGDIEVVTDCLKNGAEVNCTDSEVGHTPLHLAARWGHKDIEGLLINYGANVNGQNIIGQVPLHWAAALGNTDIAGLLINHGANVDIRDNNGETPIHLAAYWGRTETVGLLITHGANADIQNNDGQTPLHRAAYYGRRRTARLLITHGVNVSIRNNDGKTPYDLASKDIKELLMTNMSQQNPETEHSSAKKSKPDHETTTMDEGFSWLKDVNNIPHVISGGYYNSYENRTYLAGACNVGKSTLASVLIGEEIPLIWKSTDGLNIYFGRNGIDLEKNLMIPLKEGFASQSVFGKVLLGNPSVQKLSVSTSNTVKAVESDSALHSSKILPQFDVEETAVLPYESVTLKMHRLEHYTLHDEILKEVRTGQYKIKIAPSDLVDFGGQRSYDMTHQLFIQHNGSFLLMFDGRYKLTEQLKEYPQECMTSKSILIHWVNSILTYCTEEDNFLPQILFIATHSDSFSEEEVKTRKEEFEREITQLLSSHDKHQHINYDRVYFINATDNTDKEIRALTDKLVEIAFKQPSWGKPRPIAWVPLELQIVKLRSENVNIITRKCLLDLNEMNADLALSEKALEEFLRNQHSIGKIMYFNQSGLDKFIVTQPSTLVNILRSFITDKMFWPKNNDLSEILNNMNATGRLSKANLFKLWSQPQFNEIMPDDEVKTFVMAVLIHLDILVERKSYRSGNNRHSTEFLVPCIVKTNNFTDTFLNDETFDKRTICLVYILKRSAVPSALSFKLIGAAISIWPLKEDKEGRVCLFHQSAVLWIDENNELRIQVKDNRIIVYLSHIDTLTSISPDIAASIQECITKALEYVLRFYYSSFGTYTKQKEVSYLFEMQVGFVCKKSPCVACIHYIKENDAWTCLKSRPHASKYPLYWIFDKKQESCSAECAGLTEEEHKKCLKAKHLV